MIEQAGTLETVKQCAECGQTMLKAPNPGPLCRQCQHYAAKPITASAQEPLFNHGPTIRGQLAMNEEE